MISCHSRTTDMREAQMNAFCSCQVRLLEVVLDPEEESGLPLV